MLIDAHAHLQNLSAEELKHALAFTDNLQKIVVNATCEADWNDTLNLASRYHIIAPQLGIHPWYVDTVSECWLQKLSSLLLENANCGIGEIGLDYSPKYKEYRETQLLIFSAQLNLAADLKRPVSIHCVKGWEDLIRIIKQYKLTILFHGFYASVEILKELLKFDAYFSFSSKLLIHHPQEKLSELLNLIPDNRLLVESDGVPTELNETVKLLSKIKGKELEKIIEQNGEHLIST